MDKRIQPRAWLPAFGLAICGLVMAWVWWSERGDQPLFHLGVALTLLVTFGLVWLFGIRYADVGWMVVITAILTVQSAAAPSGPWGHADHVASATASFALMLAFGAFLVSFFRAHVVPGRLEAGFAASVATFGGVALALSEESFARFGLGGALQGYVGAAVLAASFWFGVRSVGPWPRKRRRYVTLVLVASLVGAGLFFAQARWQLVTPGRLTPLLNYLMATVFALFLLADLVIFHRNYFKEKASRVAQETERIKEETRLELGRSIQEIMITKDRAGLFHDFRYEFHFEPAAVMGGDWLFSWEVDSGEKRFVFGEAFGQGPQAALGVAAIVSFLHECRLRGLSLPDAFRYVNGRLLDVFERQLTSTCMAVSVADDGTVEVFNCGGLGFFVLSREGLDYRPLSSTAMGITEDLEVAAEPVALEPGDVLFAVTDGVIESPAALRRVLDWFDDELDPPRDIASIRAKVVAVARGATPADAPPADDRTVLAIEKSA